MTRGRPDRAGRWHSYDNLRLEEREALRWQQNPQYEERIEAMKNRVIYPERGIDLDDIQIPAIA